MNDHHLVLGQLVDFITGRIIDDTHDERYRQKIARLLVLDKAYPKVDIHCQHPVPVKADAKCAQVPATFIVHLEGRAAILIHYGPGSLVTRHRPAVALARLATPYQIPVVVVTNGESADILDGCSGKTTASGLGNIPSKNRLEEDLRDYTWSPISPERAEKEARILMAYEVDDRCPCDSTVCRFEEK
jgi:hypothetical protein